MGKIIFKIIFTEIVSLCKYLSVNTTGEMWVGYDTIGKRINNFVYTSENYYIIHISNLGLTRVDSRLLITIRGCGILLMFLPEYVKAQKKGNSILNKGLKNIF